jgi:hypothetical protein
MEKVSASEVGEVMGRDYYQRLVLEINMCEAVAAFHDDINASVLSRNWPCPKEVSEWRE